MNIFLSLICLAALIAGAYFLVRLIIVAVRKQDKAGYLKKLIASVVVLIAASVGVYQTRTPEQIAAQQAKIEAEKKATEEKRLADEKFTEEKRIAEQKAAEEKKIAEEQANAEKKAQEEARRQAEQVERIVAERYAFQEWKVKLYSGSDAVDEHWESLWQYTLTGASNGYMDAQTVFQNLREFEHKLIEDEMIFHNATIPQEMSEPHAKKMKIIKQGLADWVRLRRKGCENFRMAFGMGNVTPQIIQESLDMINQSDAVLLQSTAKLIVLEEEINSL